MIGHILIWHHGIGGGDQIRIEFSWPCLSTSFRS